MIKTETLFLAGAVGVLAYMAFKPQTPAIPRRPQDYGVDPNDQTKFERAITIINTVLAAGNATYESIKKALSDAGIGCAYYPGNVRGAYSRTHSVCNFQMVV